MRGLNILSASSIIEAVSASASLYGGNSDFRFQRQPGTALSRQPAARMKGYTEPQGRQQRRAFNRGYVGCMY